MRLAVTLVSFLTIGGCLGSGPTGTSLAMTVYPNGLGQPGAQHYRLRCGPATGNVPKPALACRALAGLSDPFAPVPPRTVCTALALGPQEATVTGRLRGKTVDAHLTVRDGCEIERWRRLADVVPGFPGRRS
jgi:hypothetical protein